MEEPIFFPTPAKWRAWLHKNHGKFTELWVGFHKKETGRPTMTWSESVDEALCYGWIDGICKTHGDGSYRMRFTPRKLKSIWSNVNTAKVAALTAAGKMMPAGIAAFARRDPVRSGIYSFEKKPVMTPEMVKAFKKNKAAWAYFEKQAPYYRRVATNFVVSAKKAETQERRFALLVECSAKGERLPQTLSAKPAKSSL